ncbi:AAA ATPase midasin [Coniosporium tulheliwenetii]|uniref:AAA ATPase midasin n=1 Tax=Coniosporium tulheliwenetii TaxID=3383036 RepID=A0ACC2YVS2_9PEZI|nr:AAA ATPase midasin [Cladosporium sp. JES 115]
MQAMIAKHLGTGPILGLWEGRNIDYRFFSLWEEKRYEDMSKLLIEARLLRENSVQESKHRRIVTQEDLMDTVVEVYGLLLPRLGAPSLENSQHFSLVPTSTTVRNVRSVAEGLLSSQPLLLTGLAGSGKTLVVTHLARQLNKLSTMVTLHLNEQSDAKLLIGMYTTGATPGTFAWKPGVLTTAVREGRWVFIEDLDRAPNEVISTLLPLIETGELPIPGRGETIRAARGFKLIATMRSSTNLRGEATAPGSSMLGGQFWRHIAIQMPAEQELAEVIAKAYTGLDGHVPSIMAVYSRLRALFQRPSFAAESRMGAMRPLTPRDLLKWCSRISALLSRSSSFTDSHIDDMYLEAVDCFAGSLPISHARETIVAIIAEELQIDPQRRDHLLTDRHVKYEPSAKGSGGAFRIGRASLSRSRLPASRNPSVRRPFATNGHTVRMLERVAVAVEQREPLLLVGETGTGKTTSIQHLADQFGCKLVAFNLSQQSESGDLLGGFKPVNVRSLVIPMKDEFDELFASTFQKKENEKFMQMLSESVAKGKWKRVCILWRKALSMVEEHARKAHRSQTPETEDGEQPKKKRKLGPAKENFPDARWEKFAKDFRQLDAQLSARPDAFAFTFVEGNIVKAVRNGDWVLLDEINLASPDTLEALADLLGRVKAHPNFRIFAAMNPATDVGKKDLPAGIRSRFTEIYVESPDRDPKSLQGIVETYIGDSTVDSSIAADVTALYLKIQSFAAQNMLVDGADQKPHFSLRTLTRTLSYAKEIAPQCSLRRALYEGFHMSFLTFLNKSSESLLEPIIKQHLLGKHRNAAAELKKPLSRPKDDRRGYVKEGHYWLRQGAFPVKEQPHYIITPFVRRNLDNLIRAASTRRFPVLIQGPTSSGKTSMIEYLAKRSGNRFVRINNHEHTDLQEYLGTYVSGADGKLQFQEGVLVRALREGHWVVLDELNLAPTDVLEALNRLLDDNRELLIPETQEVVRPHEDFMLFATQNPAGLYGGRKVLSRAFRNRFLELHFDDIPVEELNEILQKRTQVPPSWSERIVNVYKELSIMRQENRLFEQKSFATLRDLFRWALRKADTVEQLAINGYMLLAERVRKAEERLAVKAVIEKVLSSKGPRVRIDEASLYDAHKSSDIAQYRSNVPSASVVWTRAMRRLYVLVAEALRNNEPVLLVGETGCGKTTVCQMLADASGKNLHIVNAHQNTEAGDLIGAQRPIRNRAAIEALLVDELRAALGIDTFADMKLEDLVRAYDALDKASLEKQVPSELQKSIAAHRTKAAALFEWSDGSLVHAMKSGQYFLLDEISLADDSVLERLNSVLEPQRSLLLAEKGSDDSFVIGSGGFQFLATMNPGGDYGKKELSPALRNRFTEIWVPAMSDLEDILQIVEAKLNPQAKRFASALVSFAQWFNTRYNTSAASSISIRDTLAWVQFINRRSAPDPTFDIVHGAAMVYIDTLGANPAAILAMSPANVDEERKQCLHHLGKLLGLDAIEIYNASVDITASDGWLNIGPFSVPRSPSATVDARFTSSAPTTMSNLMRVARALQLTKPVLLEGNPGVGKTTLVTALAKAVGKPLARINLSEQTDLMDLFGSDVPVEGAQAGTFAWRDAPFLRAMKSGEWVLLDEMNLASQSILEGLNACLDHRGEVYVAELGQTFTRHPDFRVFAAQNPHHQGGGRKGLPASFVNRFTVVYADVFRPEDLLLICKQVFPDYPDEDIEKLIRFVAELDANVVQYRHFGAQGSPWEFNLRDTLRWLQLLTAKDGLLPAGTARDFLDTVFTQRFRNSSDRQSVASLFSTVFGVALQQRDYFHNLSSRSLQVGLGCLPRDPLLQMSPDSGRCFAKPYLAAMESLMICVQQSWPVILVGQSGAGKTSLVNQLASTVGADLVSFSMNSDIDAMDLVGGYEQVDPSRQVNAFFGKLQTFLQREVVRCVSSESTRIHQASKLLDCFETSNHLSSPSLAEICNALESLGSDSNSAELQSLVSEAHLLQSRSGTIDRAQFEWVDGLLVQALEQGKWLVLDNANLCSSSVLDRLNSLLEPDGYLSINEHTNENGEAKVVKPHPNFRIFMTMDPKYGELSRAMRNRAVEIYLFPSTDMQLHDTSSVPLAFPLESFVYRFRHVRQSMSSISVTNAGLVDISLDHLSFEDSPLLPVFQGQAFAGLVEFRDAMLQDTFGTRLEGWISGGLLDDWKSMVLQWHARMAGYSNSQEDFRQAQVSGLAPKEYGGIADSAYRLAALFDVCLDLSKMQQTWNQIKRETNEKRVTNMTRLERSFASVARIPNLAQESTAGAAIFLKDVTESISTWVSFVMKEGVPDEVPVALLRRVRAYWWNFLALVHASSFDEAVFQVYLTLGQEALSSFEPTTPSSDSLLRALKKAIASFSASTKLTTGLSMQWMWDKFRPQVPADYGRLQVLLRLEGLADRFDESTWKVKAPLSELCRIREAFSDAINLVLTEGVDAEGLVNTLDEAINNLSNGAQEDRTLTPYFESEFEAICQYSDISGSDEVQPARLKPMLQLLAGRSTRRTSQRSRTLTTNASQTLKSLSDYLGGDSSDRRPAALNGVLSISLLRNLTGVGSVSLAQLDLLNAELETLGESVALGAPSFCRDQASVLNVSLRLLIHELLGAHKHYFELDPGAEPDFGGEISLSSSLPQAHYFRNIFSAFLDGPLRYLNTVYAAQHQKWAPAGWSWINFALSSMLLYIPDRPFDPALRPAVERQWFVNYKGDVQGKHFALQQFQLSFTGQLENLRTRLLEQELAELGAEPTVPAIARPPTSELIQLQGEFTNLLGLLKTVVSARHERSSEPIQDSTLQQNLLRITERLSTGYRAYDDITAPVVGFLQCLNVGIDLISAGERRTRPTPDHSNLCSILHQANVFLGSAKDCWLDGYLERPMYLTMVDPAIRLHRLASLSLGVSIQPEKSGPVRVRTSIHDCFRSFYRNWKEQLSSDQQKAAAKSSLFRYRGGQEEEDDIAEDEFQDLFPNYEQEKASNPTSEDTLFQDLAPELSDLHAAIYINNQEPVVKMRALLERSAKILPTYSDTAESVFPIKRMLPNIFVIIREKLGSLQNMDGPRRTYNIYTDPNTVEARKLVALVQRLQRRFRQLREVWPEHATLSEVLNICTELLAFRHVEPVAKLLTKGEQLHATVYEWQRVASKEYSAASLYDELTNLLISWRQLELTTWARLFDIEAEKCVEDAKRWWFVAYENIVAVPEALLSSEQDMKTHARDLVKTLESFFHSTSAGQYQQRLRLLEPFREHLAMRIQDEAALQPVHAALTNFIKFFARFEQPVNASLAKGRQALEKDMRNVLQLAGWRDRTIDALRQSAKTSHRKLFKLIRKFRALLSQPVEAIIRQELPDPVFSDLNERHRTAVRPDGDLKALEECESGVPNWASRPTRFQNLAATTSLMRKMARTDESAVNGPAYIESFLSNLESEMVKLRKATPSILTEDNKDTVQQLKSRKRRLFADTLRELRQMGIKSNLGGDVLEMQESLSNVLVSLPVLPNAGGNGLPAAAEHYLYKALDLMPSVRDVKREHSGDLTANEITRSVGFLESSLHTSIMQRASLCQSITDSSTLETAVKQAEALWAPDKYEFYPTSPHDTMSANTSERIVAWLSPIATLGADIITAQATLGKFDASAVVNGLCTYAAAFQALDEESRSLPPAPEGLQTSSHMELDDRRQVAMNEFKHVLSGWKETHPVLAPVLDHIVPWTDYRDSPTGRIVNGTRTLEAGMVRDQMFKTLDDILGSIQDLEKAQASLPMSIEDAAWFMIEEQTIARSLAALQGSRVAASLRALLRELQHVNDLRSAAALFAAVLPILHQYVQIYQETLARFASHHQATTKMTYRLAKAFIQIGTQGFCMPSEKSDEKGDSDDRLEEGTGLGEGEGTEDISKDIQDDEDLTELAQELNQKTDREEIENEKDAVDMADQEMEGEMGDAPEKDEDDEARSGDEGDHESIDEEAGEVDDLGPSMVDEKMWDDGGEEADKDKEGDQNKGTSKKDEQVAGQDKEGKPEEQQGEEMEEETEAGAEESEMVGREEMEKTDPHLQEGETLDLPDELDMDNKSEGSQHDSDFEGMEDIQDDKEEDAEEPDGPEDTATPPSRIDPTDDAEAVPKMLRRATFAEPGPTRKSKPWRTSKPASASKQEEGSKGEASEQDQAQASAADGQRGQASTRDAVGKSDEDLQDSADSQPFKKLGDALEQWYNQRRQIRDAIKDQEPLNQQLNQDVDMADAEFEHLHDDQTQADTQALGAAQEDQVRALDENKALASNDHEQATEAAPDHLEGDRDEDEDVPMQEPKPSANTQPRAGEEGRPNAFQGDRKDMPIDQLDVHMDGIDDEREDDVDEVDTALSTIHLDQSTPTPRSADEARRLWTHHESSTRTLSQSLTEHLRLILAPTLATKLRGDFRTGKRLNMKRIIPYIASSYKRDKIWLRRSQPSKRSYQIMLALDDSKSMAEGGSSDLAFETLALVSRSLSMLEAGELCVVRFGEDVEVAHPFETPFSSEAGVEVFRRFGFQQRKTDVRKLVTDGIELFREARMRATSSGAELWQLLLIISDGICEDHGTIQRLIRQAMEEKIMAVFVIVDPANQAPQGKAEGSKGGQSILDLQTADFVQVGQDFKVVTKKYLDTFPFRYYLVVRDVRELPGVLATALRQWFAEVVDTAG